MNTFSVLLTTLTFYEIKNTLNNYVTLKFRHERVSC